MANGDPPNPLGSATPRAGGMINRLGTAIGRAIQPAISVDPNTSNEINRIKQAVTSLKGEMRGLADQAERYARAMGGAGRAVPGSFGGPGYAAGSPAARMAGMQAPMPTGQAGGTGATRGRGGLGLGTIGGIEAAVLLEPLARFAKAQFSEIMGREQTTARMALMNRPFGQTYTPQMGTRYAQMGRSFPGYWSQQDLYQGMGTLEQIGAITGTDSRSKLLGARAGDLGRLGGTNYAGGAGMMANLRAPGTVQMLQLAGVQVSPGGKMRDPASIYEDLYTRLSRGRSGQAAVDLFRSGQAPGSRLRSTLEQLGLDEQNVQGFLQFGMVRAQKGQPISASDFHKTIDKNTESAATNMQKFSQQLSKLKDTMSDTLIPILTVVTQAFTKILSPLAALLNAVPALKNALGALVTAAVAWQIKIRAQQFLNIGGGGPGGAAEKAAGEAVPAAEAAVGGGLLAKALSSLRSGAGSLFGKLGLEAPTFGSLAVSGLGTLASDWVSHLGGTHGGGHTLARDVGTVGKWASAGAAFGGWGALIGGGIGLGQVGLRSLHFPGIGDPWGGKGDAYDDKSLLAHPPPPAVTPGGGPLPGPGNSAQLQPDFLARLQKMFAANPKLSLTSGWRSPQEQAYLRWQLLTGKRTAAVAPVGRSRHETGRAADLGPPSQYAWLKQHATEFGVANVGAQFGEAWHYEPTGAVGATPAPAAAPTATATPSGGSAQPAATGKAAAATGKPSAPVVPLSVGAGGGGVNGWDEASRLSAIFSGGPVTAAAGDPWPVGVGDAAYFRSSTGIGGQQSGGNITIQHAEFKVEIARGTPDEVERAARYLQSILTDRSKLTALARK
jgi:hypothetical protein